MKKITFSLILIFMSYTFVYPQNGWFINYPLNSTFQLLNLQFLDINTGYITGQYGILKTTDGGNNWTNINSNSGSGYYAIHFLNSYTGYVGGHYGSSNGRILKTTNGGQNWIIQQTGLYDEGVYTVFAIDTNTVIIGENFSGSNGDIYKSTNGGQNWVNVYFDAYKGIYCIKFVNALTGFACGTSFLRTNDGGNTWNEIVIPFTFYKYSLCFLNENTGYIAGVNTIAKTTNGGYNWSVQLSNPNAYLHSISFVNANTGMSVGNNGMILRTTNGGVNWLDISRPVFDYLGGIQMLNADTVFCAGWVYDSTYRSLFLKSYSGGFTDINTISVEIPSKYLLSQNYPNPFNQTSIFKFQCSMKGHVNVSVYDVTGREVRTLVNETLQPGTYEVRFDGSELNSGVYFVRMTAGDFSETRKTVLLK